MWRSLHAAATYSGTTKKTAQKLFKKKRSSCSKNSYSKIKQGAGARKTVVEKENKEQLLKIELFKKKTEMLR